MLQNAVTYPLGVCILDARAPVHPEGQGLRARDDEPLPDVKLGAVDQQRSLWTGKRMNSPF